MMIRFFAHGDGSGGAAVDYLLAEEVAAYDAQRHRIKGETVRREILPEVLGGNADQTRLLIDNNHRKWRYTSGVIAFAASDAPTPDEQERVMQGFEVAAFAGMAEDQCNILWVRHQHMDNVELHFLIPRVELYDNRAFNAAPPGAETYFNAFRDYWNGFKGWADPQAPDRRRDLKTVFETADRAELREAIHTMVLQKIEAGDICDHTDMRRYLETLGDVGIEIKPLSEKQQARRAKQDALEAEGGKMRRRDTRIALRKIGGEGSKDTFRMEDRIYHEEWTADEFLAGKTARESATTGERKQRADRASVERLRDRLQQAIASRAKCNHTRYGRSDPADSGQEPPHQAPDQSGTGSADQPDRGFGRNPKADANEGHDPDGHGDDHRSVLGAAGQHRGGLIGPLPAPTAASAGVAPSLEIQRRSYWPWRIFQPDQTAQGGAGLSLSKRGGRKPYLPALPIKERPHDRPDPARERVAALRRGLANAHERRDAEFKRLRCRLEGLAERLHELRQRAEEFYRSAAENAGRRAGEIVRIAAQLVEVKKARPDQPAPAPRGPQM